MTHPMKYHSVEVKTEMADSLENFNLQDCPFKTFESWYEKSKVSEPNVDAMSVATVDASGVPRNRFLLFKGILDSQFVFYTNYLSHKAKDLESNPRVSLNFFWPSTKYQIRVTGIAKKCPRKLSEDYFASRDRESQLASAMSKQSSPIASRSELIARMEELKKQFPEEIPCPENWGGYFVEPVEFEFFIYGAFRLNDRFLFVKNESNWELQRLQP